MAPANGSAPPHNRRAWPRRDPRSRPAGRRRSGSRPDPASGPRLAAPLQELKELAMRILSTAAASVDHAGELRQLPVKALAQDPVRALGDRVPDDVRFGNARETGSLPQSGGRALIEPHTLHGPSSYHISRSNVLRRVRIRRRL